MVMKKELCRKVLLHFSTKLRPFVGIFPLLRCENVCLPENFQFNDSAGLVFESVCVENSSYISIAYLISAIFSSFDWHLGKWKMSNPIKIRKNDLSYLEIVGYFYVYYWISLTLFLAMVINTSEKSKNIPKKNIEKHYNSIINFYLKNRN